MNPSVQIPNPLELAAHRIRRHAAVGFWAAGFFLLLVLSIFAPLWVLPLLLVFAAGVLAVFINPYLGGLLMLFLIYSRLLETFDLGRVFMATVALTSAAWIWKMAVRSDFRIILVRRQSLLIMAFLFLIFLSIPFAHDTKVAFITVLVYLKLILLYLLLINLLTSARRFELCIYAVLVALIVAIGYGFYSFLTQPSVVKGIVRRVAGGGTDPNFFALSIISFLPLPFLLTFAEHTFWRKSFWLGVLLLMIAGILSSFSRAGILGLIFVLILLAYKIRRHRVLLLLGAGIIFALIFFLPDQVWQRMETLSSIGRDDSLRWRFKLAMGALGLFLEHPFTGVGVGNFILFSFRWIDKYQVAHNTYLEVLAELGIGGLLILIPLLWTTFSYIKNSSKIFSINNQTRMAVISESLGIGFLGFLFVASFLSLHYDYMLWVFCAFAGALRHITEREQAPASQA